MNYEGYRPFYQRDEGDDYGNNGYSKRGPNPYVTDRFGRRYRPSESYWIDDCCNCWGCLDRCTDFLSGRKSKKKGGKREDDEY